MNVSQEVFARLLNVPLVTAKSWVAGRRKPSGAAARLLQLAERRPKVLLEWALWYRQFAVWALLLVALPNDIDHPWDNSYA